MKKKNLKSLKLSKESISSFNTNRIKGGASDTGNACCHGGGNGPIEILGIDIPTINDSCFSWCDDKCNDF
jgi:hypothetical protein